MGAYITILLYIVILVGLVRVIMLSLKTAKIKKIVTAVQNVFDRDKFYSFIDETMPKLKEEEYMNKMRVVKLWGEIYHNDFDMMEDTLNEIEIDKILKNKKGKYVLRENEDALFYLCLAIPNGLYGKGQNDFRKKVEAKVNEFDEDLKDQLVYAVGKACTDYYDDTNNKGREFFEKVIDGDYGDYAYSKQLIGMYKNICSAMLYNKHKEEESERFEEIREDVKYFKTMGAGKRWFISEGLQLEEIENEEEPAEEETEEAEEKEDKEEE